MMDEVGGRGETALLRALGVSVRFGGLAALDAVDMAVRPGEVVGLVGPNGAGKSTLLDVLAGRRTPSDGRVLFDGCDVTMLTSRQRAASGIGIVLQGGRVLEHLDVAAHLELGRLAARRTGRAGSAASDVSPHSAEVVLAALAAEGVTSGMLACDLPHAARQWLELAMVLMTRPRVLLLDEPTSGMDRVGRARTAELLRSLHVADPTLATVIVEHDPTFIRDVVDRTVVLSAGRVVQGA